MMLKVIATQPTRKYINDKNKCKIDINLYLNPAFRKLKLLSLGSDIVGFMAIFSQLCKKKIYIFCALYQK